MTNGMIPVKSSNLVAVGYDAKTKELRVEFKNKKIWEYEDVPKEVVDNLIGAESVGKFFNENIKGKYKETQIK